MAAPGHNAVHHSDPGADTPGELPGAWGQDDDGAVGAPQGRFTLHFERFAVEVLLARANVQAGCELLGIGWEYTPSPCKKERALKSVTPPKTKPHQFRPGDKLLRFLDSL